MKASNKNKAKICWSIFLNKSMFAYLTWQRYFTVKLPLSSFGHSFSGIQGSIHNSNSPKANPCTVTLHVKSYWDLYLHRSHVWLKAIKSLHLNKVPDREATASDMCTLLACHFWWRGILSASPVRFQRQFKLTPLALANNKGESFATALLLTGNQLNHSNSLLCAHKSSLLQTSLAHDLLWYTRMYLFHPDVKPETALPKWLNNDLKINTEESN